MLRFSLYHTQEDIATEELSEKILEQFKTEMSSFSTKASMVNEMKKRLGINTKMTCVDKCVKDDGLFKTDLSPVSTTFSTLKETKLNAIVVYDVTDSKFTPVIFRVFEDINLVPKQKAKLSISDTYLPEYVYEYLKDIK